MPRRLTIKYRVKIGIGVKVRVEIVVRNEIIIEAYAIMQDPAALPPIFGVTEVATKKQWNIDMELAEQHDTR